MLIYGNNRNKLGEIIGIFMVNFIIFILSFLILTILHECFHQATGLVSFIKQYPIVYVITSFVLYHFVAKGYFNKVRIEEIIDKYDLYTPENKFRLKLKAIYTLVAIMFLFASIIILVAPKKG